MSNFFSFKHIDWVLVLFLLPILGAGLVTMASFGVEGSVFWRQLIWIGVSFTMFLGISFFDVSVFKKTNALVALYGFLVLPLKGLRAGLTLASSLFSLPTW